MKVNSNTTSFHWTFFGLTFLLTWGCWIPAGLFSAEQYGLLPKILHYAGGIMPTLVTLLLLYLCNNQKERREYWQRLIEWKRIQKIWYAVILLTVPLLTSVGIVFDLLLSSTAHEPVTSLNFNIHPFSLIPLAFFLLLFGPLPEEMAWRGYALDGLQGRWNALSASLILGVLWTIWHLPLFWVEGSYQHGLGVGTQQFWLYMLDKVPQSILMTWIFNNNRKSTASAVLFHFMVNFVGELYDLSLRAETITIAAWWIMAVLVIAVWKPKGLMRMNPNSE